MTAAQWKAFSHFRVQMQSLCAEWQQLAPKLYPLQKAAAQKDTPDYPLETAVVYNTAYDSVTINDDIRLVVIGDNPGKEEQLQKNRKYLVGQSGRIAEGFFRRNPDFHVDFRQNALIVNKTPVHTSKTSHLRYLQKNGDSSVAALIYDSQLRMARLTATLHRELVMGTDCPQNAPEVWLVGYAELKERGIFVPYREQLKASYTNGDRYDAAWDAVRVFQHFSMNRFLVDLSRHQKLEPQKDTVTLVREIGTGHRKEIFGA